MTQFLPILVIASSAAMYHASSKTLSSVSGNPWSLLALTYLFSFLATTGFALAGGPASSLKLVELRSAWPTAALLGLACVGIEGGYLLAYRWGWSVSHLFSLTSFTSTLAIFCVGLFLFKEAISVTTALGLALVLTGLGLTHWK